MSKKVLIVGGGFAGVWGALAAARLLDQQGKTPADVEVTLVSPDPALHIRPRLYEPAPETMSAPLLPLLDTIGVRFVAGSVAQIRTGAQEVDLIATDGGKLRLPYDRLLLTTGSKLFRPPVPGLEEHAFSVDQLADAIALDRHLAGLAALPDTPARNTVVVVGGGFTGLEVATELPLRLRKVLGAGAKISVILVDTGEVGAGLGVNPRPAILEALESLGVQCLGGSGVASIDAGGVVTASGQRIDAATVIWTAGMRASSLAAQVSSSLDPLGRVEVTPDLRVVGADHVFAAGDVARALTDDQGHYALMSCQHAIFMGRFGGHNAVADLLGLPTLAYRQLFYATCLDLGEWGAVYTEGWDRQVKLTAAAGKDRKREINTVWIYPPAPDRAAALAAGDPMFTFG
ncbi:NAD(P)/FAD-dependent oxidoreductase [Polyangium aurulentum]|uniref:NAD(P)/FAD-dependent oxidoreductase n=1 Tax=Polyangium aurulentum TaxID=2567896 RepID=UPI0010AE3E1D|nr:FAD-dependent oxidoreductase [Polyangium aurulentum]UQA57277.1 FAD-dependent oxidoreductase [Polyangium aurulentum]